MHVLPHVLPMLQFFRRIFNFHFLCVKRVMSVFKRLAPTRLERGDLLLALVERPGWGIVLDHYIHVKGIDGVVDALCLMGVNKRRDAALAVMAMYGLTAVFNPDLDDVLFDLHYHLVDGDVMQLWRDLMKFDDAKYVSRINGLFHVLPNNVSNVI